MHSNQKTKSTGPFLGVGTFRGLRTNLSDTNFGLIATVVGCALGIGSNLIR